jgi:hypothetical protein
MYVLTRIYRVFNLLSLDIAAGAICSACYFALIFDVVIRPHALASLGLTVWIIYTADHLLDARRIKGNASTERHRFHQKHFRSLLVCLILAAAIDFILIFFIKTAVVYGGFLMSTLVVLYLLLHRALTFLKEFFVATLYCCGILLPSITVTPIPLSWIHFTLITLFYSTALINLLMFSFFDVESDFADKHRSFVTSFGNQRTLQMIYLLFVINTLMCVYGFFYSAHRIEIFIPCMMNMLLLIIVLFRKWFGQRDRYRLLGDAVFLLPLFYVAYIKLIA